MERTRNTALARLSGPVCVQYVGNKHVIEAQTTLENLSGSPKKRPARRKPSLERRVAEVETAIEVPDVAPPAASPLQSVVWARILGRRKGLSRLQIALVQAFAEFTDSTHVQLGQIIGRSAKTVSRMLREPSFGEVLAEYLSERKVMGHRKYQRAVEFLADRVLEDAQKHREPNVPLIQTLGKVYGELQPDQAVHVAQQVNVVNASDRIAGILKQVGVTVVSSDRPAEVRAAQRVEGE